MHAPTKAAGALFALLSAVVAQPPAHATHLNPNNASPQLRVMHLDDVVLALTRYGPSRYSRSVDGGRTWHVVDQFLAVFPARSADADGDVVAFVGTTSDAPGSGPEVIVSRDGGLTWQPRQQVGQFWQSGTYAGYEVTVSGSTICVFWSEPKIGLMSMQRSDDAGLTWLPAPIQLGHTPPPPVNFLMYPEVVTDGTTMHVFWITRTSSGNVGRHQISTDGGATWLPSPLQTPPAPPPGGEQPFARGDPSLLLLANHGSLLHRSTDGGQTWTPLTGLLMPIVYDVAHEGQTIVVVGVDYAAPLTWYIQTSLDGGSTWQAPAFAATAASGFGATAHIAAGQLYVNFWHGSEPTWSIVAYSGDLGASWRTMQSNVSGFGPGPRRNLHLQFVGGPPGPTAAYAYVGLGWTPRGVGSAGAGGRVPQLSLSAPPILGTTTSLDVADAVGGTVGVLGLSLQPPAGVPLAGGTLWVQPPLVPILLPIGGPTGVAGAGTAAEPFAVPNVPALAGTALASQAVVLDGQAVGGLALSNAIEWFVN